MGFAAERVSPRVRERSNRPVLQVGVTLSHGHNALQPRVVVKSRTKTAREVQKDDGFGSGNDLDFFDLSLASAAVTQDC
jgi:hypothetical protein